MSTKVDLTAACCTLCGTAIRAVPLVGVDLFVLRFPCFLKEAIVPDKKTVKNQVTGADYSNVSKDGERIVRRPPQWRRAEEVRARLVSLGIGEDDVTVAVSWAREKGK
jgi:hypothetical protein